MRGGYAGHVTATFVGRDLELAALEELTSRAARDEIPAAAVILADAGAGKSRLLAEAAASSGRTQLRVAGYEPEQGIPFAAIRDLSGQLADFTEEGAQLGALLSGRQGFEPLQVFESARRALEDLDGILLLVDDLHWLDGSSVALLHYVLRSAEQERLPTALLAAARPSADVGSFAASLRRTLGERFMSVDLGKLDRDSGIRMVRELAPEMSSRAAADLWERAEGIPFWLELLASGDGSEAGIGGFLTDRLRGAGEDAAAMLAAVVVAGRPLQDGDAAAATGWPLARAREAIANLIRAGLAVALPDGVRTAHDLIRVAAMKEIPAAHMAQLHGRLAKRLEGEAYENPLLLLEALDHRQAGNFPADAVALRLARSPQRRLLGREGLSRIMRLIERADPRTSITSELHAELATLAVELGEHRTALELWAILVDRLSEPTARAEAALGAARAGYELERRDETWAFLGRARSLAPADTTVAMEADALEATVLRWMDHRPDEARAAADRAIASARATGTGEMSLATRMGYLHALAALNDAALQDDDPARMLDISEEIVGAARAHDEPTYLRALTRGGFALFSLGRPAEAELRLRSAWHEARGSYLHVAMVDAGFWLARALLAWGRVLEAEEVASEVAALGQRVGFTSRQIHNWLHGARMSRGDWEVATDALRREAEAEQDPHFRLALQLSVAAGLSRLDPSRAREEVLGRLAAGRHDADEVGCRRCWGELILRGADARARVGDEEGSSQWIDDWEAGHQPAYPIAAWWRRRAGASLSLVRGSDDAVQALEAVATEADGLGLRLESIWARIDLAGMVGVDDRDRATALLTGAAEAAGSLGAETELRVAEQALRKLGVRTWRRGTSTSGEALELLSERERQVARLVASGASNPEIARSLFISRKTVERHVSNVLAKLGIRNRTELATMLAASSGEHDSRDEGVPR